MHEFGVYEYLSRIENATLEIEENKKPADPVIVLWWGLDGLRLNQDGSMEWISRKKPKPVNQNVSYQPCQAIHPIQTGMLRYPPYMQSALVSPLQQCCVQYPVQYPSYYYGGCWRLN